MRSFCSPLLLFCTCAAFQLQPCPSVLRSQQWDRQQRPWRGREDRMELAGRPTGRREFLQDAFRVAAGGLLLAVGALSPRPADAFCGDEFPFWVYYAALDARLVPFQFEGFKGEINVQVLGDAKKEKKANLNPLFVIPGGPGLPHDYLETMEGAAQDERRVVVFDPIGTGGSSPLPEGARDSAPYLFTSGCLLAQVDAVLRSLKVSAYHVMGHGSGAVVALEKAKAFGFSSPSSPAPPERVLSATLASPLLSSSGLPPDYLEGLRAQYTSKGGKAPLCVETALEGSSAEELKYLGPALDEVRVADGLGPVSCPVLITYGGEDIVTQGKVEELRKALSGGASTLQVRKFDASGQLPHLDEKEAYVNAVQAFMADIDNKLSSAAKS